MLTRICSPGKKKRCSTSTNFLGISHSLHLHRRGQAALKHPTMGSPHKGAMNEDAVVAEGGAAAEVAEAGVEVEVALLPHMCFSQRPSCMYLLHVRVSRVLSSHGEDINGQSGHSVTTRST